MSAATPYSSKVLPHRSPGITAMYNELKASKNHQILDLGSSSGANFTFFSQMSCNIHFENLDEFLVEPAVQQVDSETMINALQTYLTDFDDDRRFDVVLTWDLFNYLDLQTIQWLMTRISKHCRDNALLHSIKCVSPTIPPIPRKFYITDQYQTRVQQVETTRTRYHACYGTAALLRNMPNFHMEHSYLNFSEMIPGLAEQLLRFKPDNSRLLRRQASDELAKNDNYVSRVKNSTGLLHRSYALDDMLQKFTQNSSITLLDLGLKNRHNYDFLYGLTNGVSAENIYHELLLQTKSGHPQELKSHMLNFPEGTQFDAILAWDIMNFLPHDMISAIFSRLAPYTHGKTLLHTIIYSGKETPKGPQQFQFVDRNNLTVYPEDKLPGNNTLTATQLLKSVMGFKLAGTYVFRPGMQRGIYEYLLQNQESR